MHPNTRAVQMDTVRVSEKAADTMGDLLKEKEKNPKKKVVKIAVKSIRIL